MRFSRVGWVVVQRASRVRAMRTAKKRLRGAEAQRLRFACRVL
jgi:hypothetical protein